MNIQEIIIDEKILKLANISEEEVSDLVKNGDLDATIEENGIILKGNSKIVLLDRIIVNMNKLKDSERLFSDIGYRTIVIRINDLDYTTFILAGYDINDFEIKLKITGISVIDDIFMNIIDDNSYRIHYDNHPDIIMCKDCNHNCNGSCSNMYSYPNIPEGYGCKNGMMRGRYISTYKYSIIDKLKCKLGFHKGQRFIGKASPFMNEILIKCECCGKYGLWHTGINCTAWYKKEEMNEKNVHISCLEMIDKYNL